MNSSPYLDDDAQATTTELTMTHIQFTSHKRSHQQLQPYRYHCYIDVYRRAYMTSCPVQAYSKLIYA